MEKLKIRTDPTACTGHARCVVYGPDVYVLDDDGYNATNIERVPLDRLDQARRGARACPERAITIEE
jgi:ferredoxin